jgi:hypothetical protein
MSVEAIHEAVSRAAARARAGEGPTLLEFLTYRYKGHSMSDPAKYRSKEELEEYKHRDPIDSVRHTILEHQLATEAELDEIDNKIKTTLGVILYCSFKYVIKSSIKHGIKKRKLTIKPVIPFIFLIFCFINS